MRSRFNFILALALVIVLGLHWALRPEPGRRNVEALPGMVKAVPAEAFSESAVFSDGKTLQPTPAGTVVRGLHPLPYRSTPEDAVRAGLELANPFPASSAAILARGKVTYETYCSVCHGPAGKGDGTVAKRGFPAPPSLLAEKALLLRDGQLFHILTYGQGNMPSYAAQVTRNDRWKAVLWVRELQKAAPAARTAGTATTADGARPL